MVRQEWNFSKPMQAGVTYDTSATITDIYKKRNRTVVNTAVKMTDDGGDTVMTFNHHQSFLLDEPVEQVEFRDPAKKEGRRKFEVPEGEEMPGFDKSSHSRCAVSTFTARRATTQTRKRRSSLAFRRLWLGSHDDGLPGPPARQLLRQALVRVGLARREVHEPDLAQRSHLREGDRYRPVGRRQPGHGVCLDPKADGTIVLIAQASVAAEDGGQHRRPAGASQGREECAPDAASRTEGRR